MSGSLELSFFDNAICAKISCADSFTCSSPKNKQNVNIDNNRSIYQKDCNRLYKIVYISTMTYQSQLHLQLAVNYVFKKIHFKPYGGQIIVMLQNNCASSDIYENGSLKVHRNIYFADCIMIAHCYMPFGHQCCVTTFAYLG